MAQNGKKGIISFEINGQNINVPLGWQDISVLATFDNDNVQANITTTEIEITGQSAQAIRDYIADGMNGGAGIFEGLPCGFTVSNNAQTSQIFEGYINLTKGFRDESWRDRVFVTIEKKDGLNNFNTQLQSNTYGFLESKGVYTSSDYQTVEYVVEKNDNALEILISSVTLYMMSKELAEATRSTIEAILDASALFVAGTTGSVGATIKAVGQAVILLAYNAILLVAVVNLANNLFASLISPVRKHKAISFRKLLEKVCTYFGYSFETDNADLKKHYFLPSNQQVDRFGNDGFISVPNGTKKGIPNASDYGYRCDEMFTKFMQMYHSRFAIINGVVHFRRIDSDYWIRKANFEIPAVLELPQGYNTDELFANRLIAFNTDVADIYTLENFTGTNCETITTPIISNNLDANYIKNLDNVQIPWALGNTKTKLNALENSLANLGGVIDTITGIFGGGTNFKSKVKNRINMLKVSSNNTQSPKILYLKGGKMPANHRDLLSAKYINDTYHLPKSFIYEDFKAQKKTYEGITIPFGFNDFVATINNSYCTTADGKEAKITKLEYNIFKDTAVVDYWVREPYTKNLQETLIEP